MSYALTIPFLCQILLIGVDEFYCHHQRKLPRWERIGHPLDTITVLACLGWLLYVPPTSFSVKVYVGLSIFSSVFILKDENVHHQTCGTLERWLHTFALPLHPVVLMSGVFLWPALHSATPRIISGLAPQGFERTFLVFEVALMVLFLMYQTVYWNFVWQPQAPQATNVWWDNLKTKSGTELADLSQRKQSF